MLIETWSARRSKTGALRSEVTWRPEPRPLAPPAWTAASGPWRHRVGNLAFGLDDLAGRLCCIGGFSGTDL